MKNLFLVLIGLFMFSSSADAQVRFGAGAQLIFDNSVFGVQGKALYQVNETIDAAGTFTIHLEDGFDWTIDLDAHYLLLEFANDIGFKPFAGLSITKFGFLGVSNTEIGVNIGAFFDLFRSNDMQFYLEPKVNIGGYESLAVSGGILF